MGQLASTTNSRGTPRNPNDGNGSGDNNFYDPKLFPHITKFKLSFVILNLLSPQWSRHNSPDFVCVGVWELLFKDTADSCAL